MVGSRIYCRIGRPLSFMHWVGLALWRSCIGSGCFSACLGGLSENPMLWTLRRYMEWSNPTSLSTLAIFRSVRDYRQHQSNFFPHHLGTRSISNDWYWLLGIIKSRNLYNIALAQSTYPWALPQAHNECLVFHWTTSSATFHLNAFNSINGSKSFPSRHLITLPLRSLARENVSPC